MICSFEAKIYFFPVALKFTSTIPREEESVKCFKILAESTVLFSYKIVFYFQLQFGRIQDTAHEKTHLQLFLIKLNNVEIEEKKENDDEVTSNKKSASRMSLLVNLLSDAINDEDAKKELNRQQNEEQM